MNTNKQITNIAVSGLSGTGTTTLAKKLRDKLGWQYFSGGDFMRAYAVEQGLFSEECKTHHFATTYDDDFDRKVDYGMRERMLTEKKVIYDSWLCGFLAQGTPGVYKVLCVCSDDAVRVDRLANRDGITIMEAKKHVFDRERENIKKWRRMYRDEWEEWVVKGGIIAKGKPAYYWYPEMYDMVIDTFRVSKDEAFQMVWREIKDRLSR